MPLRLRTLPLALAALALVLALPGVAPAKSSRTGHTVDQSKLLWATINVCDTAAHPETIGLRASMPGSGDPSEEMFMRFQTQFFNTKDGAWHNLTTGGDSGFVDVGSGKFNARETGRFFTFAPPAGRSYQLRGIVSFEWREAGAVVRRATKRTTSGHKSAAGADPAGFTAATCTIGPAPTSSSTTTTP